MQISLSGVRSFGQSVDSACRGNPRTIGCRGCGANANLGQAGDMLIGGRVYRERLTRSHLPQIAPKVYWFVGLLLAVSLVVWIVRTHGIESTKPLPAQLDAATSVERANTGEAAASRGEK